MRRPARSAAPEPSVSDIGRTFSAIAACIEAGGSPSAVASALRTAWSACDRIASALSETDAKRRLVNVQQALQTWQRVWPRMGAQHDFRTAVIRESRLWAKTLS